MQFKRKGGNIVKELKVNVDEEQAKHHRLNLTGPDIMPVKYGDRTITPKKMIAIWFVMAVVISTFMLAAQLYPSLKVWEIMLVFVVSCTVLSIVMCCTQDFGIKWGLNFTVSCRAAFGYAGAFIPAYLRALPAMFWFGFQTWVAALALNSVTLSLWNFDNLTFWIIVLGVIQIAHTTLGIKAITRFSVLATPLLLIVGFIILFKIFSEYNYTLSEVMMMGGDRSGSPFWLGVVMFIGAWATMAVTIMDITKDCVFDTSATSWWGYTKGFFASQWIGLAPATIFFAFVGVVSMIATGDYNPVTVIVEMAGDNTILLVTSMIFILIATWSTNDTANLYPVAYVLTSTFPKKITFSKGVVIAGLIGLAIRPWSVADSLTTVANIFGTVLAPVTGILICDYYVLRKRQLNLDELYKNDGQYKYWHNVNPAAIISLVVAIVVSIPVWDYIYFVGIFVGGLAYYFLMKYWIVKIYPQPEIIGLLEKKENISC
jgi:NCS1 family nucleobase:cation symporter-1